MIIFKIEENDSSQRLDKFLKKLLPNAWLSLIFKLNRKNKIKVNSKRQDNEYKLQVWDEVKIFLSDDEFKTLNQKILIKSTDFKNTDFKKDIVYEDSEILVINKNPWLMVHPWDFKTKDLSLIQQVHDYLWDKLNSLTFKPSLVHRIDKDTSGIVIIAKTKNSLTNLLSQLQNNKIDKYYLALCLNSPTNDNWIINKKIARIENAKNQDKIIIDEKDWQKAITHYKVLKKNEKYSLIECKLETWRMHQIRIHLSSINCPILWDKTYWNKDENYNLSKNYWINRQLLHAYKIIFIHPKTGKKIELNANLKSDFETGLKITLWNSPL